MRQPGSARLGSMLCIRRASVACEKSPRVAHECVRLIPYIRTYKRRRARSAGRFHAWTMAAVTLKRALPLSYASACGQPRVQTCATPLHLSLLALPRSEVLSDLSKELKLKNCKRMFLFFIIYHFLGVMCNVV
jgi:hypothetical protein